MLERSDSYVKRTKWMSWDDFMLNNEMEKSFPIKFHKTSNQADYSLSYGSIK